MEIKKIQNCNYVMFPRLQHCGLKPEHVERNDTVTQLRSFICSPRSFRKISNSIYIILIYYNILYNIKFTPQDSATI